MGDQGIRNLDQLQEDDDRRMPPSVTMTLVALGGGCAVFACLTLGGRSSQLPTTKSDPLGDLVSRSSAEKLPSLLAKSAMDLSPGEVTFPHMLSDEDRPTTALAAVHANANASDMIAAPIPSRPPPATDRLPVVPLPAQSVLEATPIVTRPRDALMKAATDAAQITTAPTSGDVAAAGHEGGYQLQVSSFHAQNEAEAFAQQLRARGHRAYVLEARVVGRGTWFRVRIGPFPTQHIATQYRASFEAREHVVPFIVPPRTLEPVR